MHRKLGILMVLLAAGCSSTNAPPEATPGHASTSASAKLTEVTLKVDNMTGGGGCVKAVTAALTPLPGVAEVDVDFAKKLATCKVDKEKFDVDNAIATLKKEDYPATQVQ